MKCSKPDGDPGDLRGGVDKDGRVVERTRFRVVIRIRGVHAAHEQDDSVVCEAEESPHRPQRQRHFASAGVAEQIQIGQVGSLRLQ